MSPTTSLTNASGVAIDVDAGWRPRRPDGAGPGQPDRQVSFSASGHRWHSRRCTPATIRPAPSPRTIAPTAGATARTAQLGKATSKTIFAPSTPVTSDDSLIGPRSSHSGPSSSRPNVRLRRRCGQADVLLGPGRRQPRAGNSTAVTFTPPTTVNTVATVRAPSLPDDAVRPRSTREPTTKGELGNGTTTTAANYAAVHAAAPTIYLVDVSAGSLHSCGMPRYARANTVKPVLLGFQFVGPDRQRHHRRAADTPTAVTLPVLVTELDSTSLVVGAAHSCAIVSASTSLQPDGKRALLGKQRLRPAWHGGRLPRAPVSRTSRSPQRRAAVPSSLTARAVPHLRRHDRHQAGVLLGPQQLRPAG